MISGAGKIFLAIMLMLGFTGISFSCYAGEVSRLNRAANLPLAGETWEFAPLKQRLRSVRINLQSSPGRHSAFLNGKKVFGEVCMEIAVITDRKNQNVSSIDFIFANKGDISRRSGTAIRQSIRSLRDKLTVEFGKPEKGTLGPDTKKFRRDVQVWHCGGCAIMLESERGEYAIIHIRPAQQSVSRKPEKIAGDLSGNVVRNEFGDVFIRDIPMIDQGGKGYCAVATAARVVMYLGIKDAGMHLLADVAKSDAEDGTSLAALNQALKPLCREYGMKQKFIGEVSVKAVKKYIDRGIPVLWTMFATNEYESMRRSNAKLRMQAGSPEAWAKILRKQRTVKSSRKNSHLCLIVGYNELTGEIAVSNSWGIYENIPGWVPEKSARKVCQKYAFVLLP